MSNFVTLSKRNVLASSSTDVNNPWTFHPETYDLIPTNFVEYYYDDYEDKSKYGIEVNNSTSNSKTELNNSTSLMCFMWFTFSSHFSLWRFRMFSQFEPTPYQHSKLVAITPAPEFFKPWAEVLHGTTGGITGAGTAYCFDVGMIKDEPYVVKPATGYGANIYSSNNTVTLSTDNGNNTLKVIDIIKLKAADIDAAPGTLGSRTLFTKQYNSNNIAFATISEYYAYDAVYRKGGMGGAWIGRFVGMALNFTGNKLTIKEVSEEIDRYNMDNYWYNLQFPSSRKDVTIWVLDTTGLDNGTNQYTLDPQDGT